MSSYYFLSEGEDPSVGVDIDQMVYPAGETLSELQEKGGVPEGSYGDYEILRKPQLSGGSYVIPNEQDMGIPEQYKTQSGDIDYRMKGFMEGDQTKSMEDIFVGETFNGRLHDASIVKDTVIPKGSDIVINKDNNETSIRGLLEQNAVNDIFFSDMNMKGLHESVRYGVHLKTEKVIANQSQNELYTVMRSIMLQYANFQVETDNIIDEIRRLNGKVILYCVDNISSNVLQHMEYINDLSRLPEPIDRPVLTERNNFTYDISNLL
jgi:hypothetical protein